MALWLARAGKHGEFEQKFLEENRIYLTWEELEASLANAKSYEDVREIVSRTYTESPKGQITNWTGQISAFSVYMQIGDLFVMPLKHQPAIAIGVIESGYQYDAKASMPYRHYRKVKWLNKGIPRNKFDQDLLYSFGAFLTFCEIKRNNAESRVKAILGKGKEAAKIDAIPDENQAQINIEELAQDQLANFIIRKFKGYGLERLVEAILKAQGYITYHSPKGADGGKDILACSGNLGFGEQRICVQVKSGDAPVDSPTLDQLIGAMQKVNATHGLLVAWGGFKQSLEKERARQFFIVRLWDQNDLIQQIQQHYDKLEDEIKAELPLKRIWMIADIEKE
ncbi:MAG TPA: restriction endonuclease [Rickettsiales bacterium]|nr:restriction endonuclease [Rickettsiales bacterium]